MASMVSYLNCRQNSGLTNIARNREKIPTCSSISTFRRPGKRKSVSCVAESGNSESSLLLRAVEISTSSVGLTAPHPNYGCVVATHDGTIVGEGFLYAQGTKSAEVIALEQAGEAAKGSTAYLNMEPGDCHGDDFAVKALIEGGVLRVVIGMRNPMTHQWGKPISALHQAGISVDILGEGTKAGDEFESLIYACREVNAPLLYRTKHKVPFSILKYAMTLDGKIAATTGHSAWVTSPLSRQKVFETRARSDAIVVGGNTVRRDDPRLTTRQPGGHTPFRLVLSRTLSLPASARLWDVSDAPTLVLTQRGARQSFQRHLAEKGVEVVELDFLNPRAVMEYCHGRGFLQVLWECGGTLAAPAVAAGVIHKVNAFIAPKIIGGVTAPSPVGDLGFVEMTQALQLSDTVYSQVGPDMLVSGYLHPLPDPRPPSPAAGRAESAPAGVREPVKVSFYKAWDLYGALSNFSAHPIHVGALGGQTWTSVEHYYQAQKFAGSEDPLAVERVREIREARSPEEAAKIGRRLERTRPDLVRSDWPVAKLTVMYDALRVKFTAYPHLRELLLSTGGAELVEASPHDYFWGSGRNGDGMNHLGKLLMRLRDEFRGGQASGGPRLDGAKVLDACGSSH